MHCDTYAPEYRFTKRGEVLVWPNHLRVLLVLFEAPSKCVRSRTAWVAAAMRRFGGFKTNYLEATYKLERSLTECRRVGSADTFKLTARGEDVLFARVPVWIAGKGPYDGRLWHEAPMTTGRLQ
jgi:hypothetical protein